MTQLTAPSTDGSVDRPSTGERLTAAAGPAFVVCILVGNSLTESVLGDDSSPAGTVSDLVAQGASNVARTGMVLDLIGLLLLVVLAARLTALGLRQGATSAGVLVGLSASLVVAVKLASAAPYLAALAAAEELPAETLQALVDVNDAAFVVGWLPFALFVGSAALTLREAAGSGRVLVGTGIALGVLGLVAGAVGSVFADHAVPIPFLLGVLWTGAVGLRLALRG